MTFELRQVGNEATVIRSLLYPCLSHLNSANLISVMHYQVLARKWRPQTFSELIGQPHIVRTLKNALLQKRIAQAYLLAGTRGVGKTTVARIFAKAIRCENLGLEGNPCDRCTPCLEMKNQSSMDLIEIDGASHNGVESIRNLIDSVQYLPTSGKYKIYIIDEVHMLSTSAFNALLKTLEEPPAHIIFIFATTEPEKLLKTVLSRCQRLDFRNVSPEDLIEYIKHISDKESIQFESPNLIDELAHLGQGSVRDTLSLLDQLLNMSTDFFITEEVFSLALGVAQVSQTKKLLHHMLEGDFKNLTDLYGEIFKNNIDLKAFAFQINHEVFKITQSPENQNSLNLSQEEVYWIFEALNKDLPWILESVYPRETLLIILQKISLRHRFFQTKPSQSKNIEKKKPKPNLEESFSWEEVVNHFNASNPALFQALKQSIPLNKESVFQDRKIVLAYSKNHEILQELATESREVIESVLKNLFPHIKLKLEFQSLPENINKEKGFKSLQEQEDQRLSEKREERRNSLKNDQYIKLTQKIFDIKIDKIKLKENKEFSP